MHKRVLMVFLLVIAVAVIVSGCTSKVNTAINVVKNTNKQIDELEKQRRQAKDTKRVADIDVIKQMIQFYAADLNKLPTGKDGQGNFKTLKLVQGSSDYAILNTALKEEAGIPDLPIDPSDPDKYYEYYSNGKVYSIKARLEENTQNCKFIKQGDCEYELKGDLVSAFDEVQKQLKATQ